MSMAQDEKPWWSVTGAPPDNHNYVLRGGVQYCHLCDAVESPPRVSSGDLRIDRAVMHVVHGVRAHLTATAKEWSRGQGQAEGRVRAAG